MLPCSGARSHAQQWMPCPYVVCATLSKIDCCAMTIRMLESATSRGRAVELLVSTDVIGPNSLQYAIARIEEEDSEFALGGPAVVIHESEEARVILEATSRLE